MDAPTYRRFAPGDPTPRVGLVLWDLGGVVVDVDLDRGRAELLRRTGRDVFEAAFFDPETRLKERLDRGELTAEAGLNALQERLGVAPVDAIAAWNAVLTVRPEVTALILALAVPVGVISNADPVHAAFIRANAGIDSVVQHWTWSYEHRAMKPDAALFERALEVHDAAPPEVLLIDDREDNVAAALALGMDAVRYTTPSDLHLALRARGLALP